MSSENIGHCSASDSGRRPGEHMWSTDHRWESPSPGRPGEEVLQHHWSVSYSLPWPKLPPTPRPWGITAEAVSSGSSQPAAQPLCKDIEIVFEEVVECLWDVLSREKLLLLLNEFLERIEAEASLSREDSDELHKYLKELKRALGELGQERLPKEQLDRRRFLNKFPRVKQQLEEFIGKFHELADKVEKVHKGCTISNVMAHSTGAVSSILTIIGLALAPVTMGASVVLLGTGIGLGAAAAVTSVSTTIIEHVKRLSAETGASRMMSTVVKKWKVLLEVLRSNPHTVDTTGKVTEAEQCIEMHIHALETGSATPGSAAKASVYMSLGRIAASTIQQIMASLAKARMFLLVDVVCLVKELNHLHVRAMKVAAETLRQQAWQLERKLEDLTKIYEILQEDLI